MAFAIISSTKKRKGNISIIWQYCNKYGGLAKKKLKELQQRAQLEKKKMVEV